MEPPTGPDAEARNAAPFFEPARHDGPLWKIPLVTLATMFLAAVPLGIARRAREEFTALAVRKSRGPAGHSIGHDAAAQVELTRAEAMLAAARPRWRVRSGRWAGRGVWRLLTSAARDV